MNNNKENLEGIVSKLKEQGINAGEQEKQRIVDDAKKKAAVIVAEAEALSKDIVEQANAKAEQAEKNAQTAIVQASRDMIEATKISLLKYLKSVFGSSCESLFTQEEYLQELTKAVVETIPGNKVVQVSPEMVTKIESFLLEQVKAKQIELKPLAASEAKIVISSTDKDGVQFVLSAQDVEDGLFSLLNKELVQKITKKQEV